MKNDIWFRLTGGEDCLECKEPFSPQYKAQAFCPKCLTGIRDDLELPFFIYRES